jgi:hypothetical protein
VQLNNQTTQMLHLGGDGVVIANTLIQDLPEQVNKGKTTTFAIIPRLISAVIDSYVEGQTMSKLVG